MFNNVTNAHAGARCPSFYLRACISLFPVCAVRICVYLFIYACTCFSKHAPSLVQLRHNDDDDSFASRSRDSPSLFRLSLRIVALVASLRCCSVSRFQCAFETSLQFSARTKRKKNLILPRVMRFFNRKFHTSNRETKRVSFEMYFRDLRANTHRDRKKKMATDTMNNFSFCFFSFFLFRDSKSTVKF